MNVMLVFLGGGTGAVARYAAGVGYLHAFGPARSYLATLTVNIAGGLAMGFLAGWIFARGGAGETLERWRLLLGVGVLGGFTTFSSFSLETVLLLERRSYGAAVGYAAASVTLAVGALMVGLTLARRAFG